MPYSLDTSGLLDGWVRYYAPEVFPSLWKQMEAAAADGTIVAVQDVLLELALLQEARQRPLVRDRAALVRAAHEVGQRPDERGRQHEVAHAHERGEALRERAEVDDPLALFAVYLGDTRVAERPEQPAVPREAPLEVRYDEVEMGDGLHAVRTLARRCAAGGVWKRRLLDL